MRQWKTQVTELVESRYQRVVGYAAVVAGDSSMAEDLAQEAIIGAYGSARRFADVDAAEAYVRRSIVNRHIDGTRASRRFRAILLGRDFEEGTARDAATVAEATTDVQRALAVLTPRERACVVLRHMDQFSTRETAEALNLAEGSVKRYLADGVAKLTAALAVDVAPATEFVRVREARS